MKKIIAKRWQITTLTILLLSTFASYFINFMELKLSFIFAGLFFIAFGVIHNINANEGESKYYNKSDVMKTSPLTVISISIGFFLLFKSTL